MHGGEIEASAAGGAAARLEDGGFGAEVVNFFAFGFGFGAVAFDKFAVLEARV